LVLTVAAGHASVTLAGHACAVKMKAMAAPGATILVVDDDPKIGALVRAYLERERYRVVTAADGRAALAALDASAPRLVVLDLMLPELDGLAVIRAACERGDVPILPG
jgi:DNA-binding response OmpR family regulator